MSGVPTAPVLAEPETTISTEWMWLDVEAEVLAAEVEEFLATARTSRRTPPRTSTLAAALPASGLGPVANTVRRLPRQVPAPDVQATERAPPQRQEKQKICAAERMVRPRSEHRSTEAPKHRSIEASRCLPRRPNESLPQGAHRCLSPTGLPKHPAVHCHSWP